MKKTLCVVISSMVLSSCELFVIGQKAQKHIEFPEYTQASPKGSVYLFKAELDSNNIAAATQVLIRKNGTHYNGLDQVEIYDEVARIKRIYTPSPITSIMSDTLNAKEINHTVEIDIIHNFQINTIKSNDNWFINNLIDDNSSREVINN